MSRKNKNILSIDISFCSATLREKFYAIEQETL